ncbi:DMT family transporter [Solibaculum mannosilyticum]|uniref:DMT family transporter n=1 Tax=Solibaculum mannosilyticum TaxID=2780922 RepID=UPI0034BAFFFD
MSTKMDAALKKPWMVALIAIFCCVLWGSASPCIKIGYEMLELSPDSSGAQVLFAGLRFTLAGFLALLFGSLLEKKILLPRKSAWGKILKLSVFQTSLQYFCLYVGLAHTTGVNGSIIIGTNTLFTILVAALLFRQEKLNFPKVTGCIVGFAGVLLANLADGGFHLNFSLSGEGLVAVAVLSYAFSSCFLKRYSQDENPVMLSGYQFIVGGVTLTVIGLLMGGRFPTFSPAAAGMLVYLALVSALAYSLWGMLLKVNPVSKVSIYGFMNPVVGVLLSALLLGEGGQAFRPGNVIALLLVSLGIFVVNRFGDTGPHSSKRRLS